MAGEFRVVAPVKAEHEGAICELLCKTFGNYSEWQERGAERFVREPYSFAHSRIGLMDGKVVTHFGIIDYQMWVGKAKLRVAGVGCVATDVNFRKRGLMMKTALACVDAMRDVGFDFSLLFGIDDFYHRLGYTRAWSGADFVASLGKLTTSGDGIRLQTMPLEFRGKLAHLHRRFYRAITGAAVLPFGHAWNTGKHKDQLFVWKRRNKVTGYLVARDQGARVDVLEGVGTGDEVLNAAVHLAKQFSCDEIRFLSVAERSELGRRLKSETVERQVRYRRNAGPLGRVISLPRALQKMEPELEQRLKQGGLADYRGDLAISDDRDSAVLAIERGRVKPREGRGATKHRIAAGAAVSQLILGTDDPLETARAANMRVTGDARFLLPVLFPDQKPMLQALDQF